MVIAAAAVTGWLGCGKPRGKEIQFSFNNNNNNKHDAAIIFNESSWISEIIHFIAAILWFSKLNQICSIFKTKKTQK